MMRLKEVLDQMEEQTDIPFAYYQFNKPPSIPFIVYLSESSDNFGADNKVYSKINNCRIELYSDIKDWNIERKLEDLLDENEIFYNKYEDHIREESLFRTSYSVAMEVK